MTDLYSQTHEPVEPVAEDDEAVARPPVPREPFRVRVLRGIDEFGKQIRFHVSAIGHIPYAVRHHRYEILQRLGDISFSSGALAVIGGTVFTVAFITSFAGIELGVQGYSQLSDIGVEALTGFVSAYINTRLVAPVIAGISLVATVGAGMTAQLGSMRVAEEIDALDVMSVKSVPFLISTRIVAGFFAIIPLYAVALLTSYFCTRGVVTVFFGQSAGAYDHYFAAFLIPSDIVASFVKVLIMAVVIMTIHTYYGYTATGGPAGVGRAVGHAVRLSLVAMLFTDMLLSFALYGATSSINFAG